MSDKLVVEFYDSKKSVTPVACIQACHGGDNPSSAATTLNDFFADVSSIGEPRFDDASVLAARFVVWESGKGSGHRPFDFSDVGILQFQETYGYQIARVYTSNDPPYVHFIRDEWTSEQELMEAAMILGQRSVDSPAEVISGSSLQ